MDEALVELERTWSLESGTRYFQSWDGLCAALASRDRDRIRLWLSRIVEYANDQHVGFFKTLDSSIDDRRTALDYLRSTFEQRQFSDPFIAVWAAYLGDADLALDAMLRSPDAYSLWLPVMEDMRRQPEFKRVVQSLGLDDYWRQYRWPDLCQPVGAGDFECR